MPPAKKKATKARKPKKKPSEETLFHEGHKLTKHQEAFVKYYCISWNATQSALKAGYSKNGARQSAHNLLSNTYIQAAITERLKKIDSKLDIQAERIVAEVSKMAFLDVGDYIDPKTGLFDLKKAMANGFDTSTIQELNPVTILNKIIGYKIKFHSKDKCLEMLSRIKSMFKDTVEHTGNVKLDTVNPKDLTLAQLREVKSIRETVKSNGGNGNHK